MKNIKQGAAANQNAQYIKRYVVLCIEFVPPGIEVGDPALEQVSLTFAGVGLF